MSIEKACDLTFDPLPEWIKKKIWQSLFALDGRTEEDGAISHIFLYNYSHEMPRLGYGREFITLNDIDPTKLGTTGFTKIAIFWYAKNDFEKQRDKKMKVFLGTEYLGEIKVPQDKNEVTRDVEITFKKMELNPEEFKNKELEQ